MIIRKVIIKNFAGLSGKEMDFKEGLNVITGPNESGKSTIFHAIKNTLFTPSNLTPARLKKQLQPFFPVEGGDTIEVTIHFKGLGDYYTLIRRWGASPSSSLTIPGGSVLSDDDSIQSLIRGCIQVPEGTCKTVMMAYQAGLSRTVQDIRKDSSTLESLGDLLRNAVMEMDGMSVDAFRAKIEESYNSFFGRWYIDAGYPEGNRGLENPWIKGAGTITSLFYEKERAKRDLENAVDYERELDGLNWRISSHASELEKARSYVERYKGLRDDAVLRRQIQSDLKSLDLEYEKLKKVNKDWPVAEARIKEKKKRISQLEAKEKSLNLEKKEAERYEKGRELLDKYARVEKKRKAVEEARKAFEEAGNITAETLKTIREAFRRKGTLETSLSAGKFFLKITPEKDMELEIQKGVEDTFHAEAKGGETFELQAGGKVLLSHSEWKMELISGEVEYDQVLAEYEKAKSDIEGLLEKFNVGTLEEAEDRNKVYERELAGLKNAKANMEDELGEFTYDELKEKVKGFKDEEPQRKLEEILNDLSETNAETNRLKGELKGLEEMLQSYIDEFGDHSNMLEKLTEVAGTRKEKKDELGRLKPLPAGIEDLDGFIEEYEKTESRLEKLKDEYNTLIQERIRLEGRAPERSVEEFERDLAEAEERFDTELRRGMAIRRIKQSMESLLDEMDSITYKGLERRVSELMKQMTGGRYNDVAMVETMPSGFYRKDGLEIPYDYLSAGTQDVLGIALRLAITEEFLDETEGFVLMDDPLVDLDPDRQSRAAEAIKDFAEKVQVILLTCHPAHADLLGGNQIKLGE